MVKFSSSEKNEKNNIKQYGLGDMTSTVYPLDGALEDWAYGGWEFFQSKNTSDINPIKICKPDSFNKDYNMLWNYNDNNNNEYFYDYKLRCLIYLAEASNNKIPDEKEYGINDFDLEGNTRDVFDFYKTNNFYGHIPRNMRLVDRERLFGNVFNNKKCQNIQANQLDEMRGRLKNRQQY